MWTDLSPFRIHVFLAIAAALGALFLIGQVIGFPLIWKFLFKKQIFSKSKIRKECARAALGALFLIGQVSALITKSGKRQQGHNPYQTMARALTIARKTKNPSQAQG